MHRHSLHLLLKRRISALSERKPFANARVLASKPIGLPELLFGGVIVGLPFLVAIINPIWLSNGLLFWDVWFYYGYFTHLYQFISHPIWPASAYIGTRIPYILPGFIFHRIFGDELARYIFNLFVVSGTILFSCLYVLRNFMPLSVAATTTAILALDLFFLRSMGWDYVDKGIIAYECLTLVMLTLAATRRRAEVYLVGAGFMATSMIFIHLGSVVLFPIFLFYSAFVMNRVESAPQFWRHFTHVVFFGVIGAILCQIIYGSLTVSLHGGDFFFLWRQIRVLKSNLETTQWNVPLPALLAYGYWITNHLAAFTASVIALLSMWWCRENQPPTRFELFCFWTASVGYGMLFIGEATHRLFFFSAIGMYASMFIPITFFCFGNLIFRNVIPSRAMFIFVILVSIGSLMVRFDIGNGLGLYSMFNIPMVALGLTGGCLLAATYLIRSRSAFIAGIVGLAVLNCFVPWPYFSSDITIRDAHAFIARTIDNRLPTVLFDKNDPHLSEIDAVIGSFTERAVFASRNTYPEARADFKSGDAAVILTSKEASADRVRAALLRSVQDVSLIGLNHIGDLWIYIFNITSSS
jgi:hypothetical protein